MKLKYLFLIIGPFLIALVLSNNVFAQEKPDYVSEKPEISDEETIYGWHPLAVASFATSFTHNRNMTGVEDGSNVNIGLILKGALDYLHESGHMWSSTLGWQLNYLYTPTLDRFTKSLDAFVFETAYLYHIPKAEFLGPFVSFTLKTSIFKGYIVKADDTAIRKIDQDGNLIRTSFVPAKENIDLTTFFAPTTLRESVGFFGDLIDEKPVKLQLRGGVGAWEIFVQDGFTLENDPNTPELELMAMQDSVQFGGEFKAMASGIIYKIVSYAVKMELMYPFVHNVDTDLSGFDLLNLEIEHLISIRVAKWLAIDYSFKAYHIPFIYRGWQVQNGLFVTLTVGIM